MECGLASSICELAKQGAKEGFETAFDTYASRWKGPVCGSVDRLSWVKAMQEGDEACCECVLLASKLCRVKAESTLHAPSQTS